jgi:hypothetical protein
MMCYIFLAGLTGVVVLCLLGTWCERTSKATKLKQDLDRVERVASGLLKFQDRNAADRAMKFFEEETAKLRGEEVDLERGNLATSILGKRH